MSFFLNKNTLRKGKREPYLVVGEKKKNVIGRRFSYNVTRRHWLRVEDAGRPMPRLTLERPKKLV